MKETVTVCELLAGCVLIVADGRDSYTVVRCTMAPARDGDESEVANLNLKAVIRMQCINYAFTDQLCCLLALFQLLQLSSLFSSAPAPRPAANLSKGPCVDKRC